MGGTRTVETEINGDSRSTYEMGSFLGWFVGLVVPVPYKRFFPALAALVGPVNKIFLYTPHII